ncbi:MAG: hypothetical protein HZB43_11210 [candidate division Zixibacteria bacterium]|nr:hypothetical protein [candidate division Zixibacteria bacterium]
MSDTGIAFIQEGAMFMAIIALIAWMIYLLFRRYQVRTQESARRLDLFSKLVDKFGDSKEFVTFVQSDEGRKLLKESGVNGTSSRQTALRMFVVGALMLAVGFGFLVGAPTYDHATDMNLINKSTELRIWGKLALGLGMGFVAAGLLTHYLGGEVKKGGKS